MKLTNDTGLPAPIVNIAEKLVNSHPTMKDGEFSVTEVLKSVRQVVLQRRFNEEITRDVQDTFSMWNGTAIHDLLEAEGKKEADYITEQRLYMTVNTPAREYSLSGEFDLLCTKNNVLYDYKTCKIAGMENNRDLKDTKWISQLYLYAALLEANGKPRPKEAVIVAMMTDHSKIKARTTAGYPQHPIVMLKYDLTDSDFADKVLYDAAGKMNSCQYYLEHPEEELPYCSFADCWCKEDYAIMKPDAKRASKTFTSEQEAREALKDCKGMRLYHRVSDFKNCRDYCPCAPFCSQWAINQNAAEVKEDITDYVDMPF